MAIEGHVRGKISIAGIGETEVGKVPGRTGTQLYAEVVRRATHDAGIGLQDIDGLITGNSRVEPYLYHAEMVAEYLGIRPPRCLTVNTGGSTSSALIQYAAGLIATGVCRNVVIAKADNLATGMGRDATIASMATIGHPQFEFPFGPPIPGLYALMQMRYMHEYGVAAEHIAEAAVVDRYHASLNPAAQFRQPLTVDDVMSSRLICDPLHMFECATVSDGGAAIVVRSVDDVRDQTRPVYVLGIGESHDFEHVTQAPSLTTTGAVESAREAYTMAAVGPEDVDVAMIYDAFAFIQPLQLEDLGFCEKGDGGWFIAEGHTRLGGRLPTNTHGGVLSHSHAGKPSGLFMVTEAVRQLRGHGDARQVPDAEVALVHTEGGILASHCTLLLGTEVA